MTSTKIIFFSTAQAFLLLCILVLNTNALPVAASDERNYSLRGAITPNTSIDHENENSLPDIIDNVKDEITTSVWDSVDTAFRKLLSQCGFSSTGIYANGPRDKDRFVKCKKWSCEKFDNEMEHPTDYYACFNSKKKAKEIYDLKRCKRKKRKPRQKVEDDIEIET